MLLEQTILNQSETVDIELGKVSSALLTLRASRSFQKDKLTHRLHRVDLYVEDVDSDWLENWDDTTSK